MDARVGWVRSVESDDTMSRNEARGGFGKDLVIRLDWGGVARGLRVVRVLRRGTRLLDELAVTESDGDCEHLTV
jgi:hypothetical protein